MFLVIHQYASYKLGVYNDKYKTAEANNTAWIMVGFFNRTPPSARIGLSEPELPYSSEMPTDVEAVLVDQLLEKHLVQLWSAYNSLVCEPSPTDALLVVDNAFALLAPYLMLLLMKGPHWLQHWINSQD